MQQAEQRTTPPTPIDESPVVKNPPSPRYYRPPLTVSSRSRLCICLFPSPQRIVPKKENQQCPRSPSTTPQSKFPKASASPTRSSTKDKSTSSTPAAATPNAPPAASNSRPVNPPR